MIPTPAPKVFVCILNWNKRDDTLRCIDAVLAQDYPNLRTVVIDNASTDNSLSALRALGDRIDLIEHAENLGYTGGCNAGMRPLWRMAAITSGCSIMTAIANRTPYRASSLMPKHAPTSAWSLRSLSTGGLARIVSL